MITTFFFDMFDTLADAHRAMEQAECDALNVSLEEWGKAMWEERLTYERGMGIIRTVREMIDRACENLPVKTTSAQRAAAENARIERMRMAMTDIDPKIVGTIRRLKNRGFHIGLISNADVCDRMYWNESPLYPLFDDAIFSCDVGLTKPDRPIYELALTNLGAVPGEVIYVGDGGNDELAGAKALGMHTVCTEFLRVHEEKERRKIHQSASWVIRDFEELERIGSLL